MKRGLIWRQDQDAAGGIISRYITPCISATQSTMPCCHATMHLIGHSVLCYAHAEYSRHTKLTLRCGRVLRVVRDPGAVEMSQVNRGLPR